MAPPWLIVVRPCACTVIHVIIHVMSILSINDCWTLCFAPSIMGEFKYTKTNMFKLQTTSVNCMLSKCGSCAHVLAVVYQIESWMVQGLDDIPDDVSCTSTEQQWHKPRGRKIEPTAVSSMTFAKPSTTTASRKRKPVIPTYCDNRFNFILCIKKIISAAQLSEFYRVQLFQIHKLFMHRCI